MTGSYAMAWASSPIGIVKLGLTRGGTELVFEVLEDVEVVEEVEAMEENEVVEADGVVLISEEVDWLVWAVFRFCRGER